MENNKRHCEVCGKESKYQCPKCNILYCSIECYKAHKMNCKKKESPFIPLQQMNDDTIGEDLMLLSKTQSFVHALESKRKYNTFLVKKSKRNRKRNENKPKKNNQSSEKHQQQTPQSEKMKTQNENDTITKKEFINSKETNEKKE
ncbi:HIT zinc finger, putative [Entamoeba histolytica HM-1:IMSS-B]|uniref:HIT-type domain-containing protein n=6 Tax=Entamoeba histolytica TaxID=5759 RepID=C4M918_ENTH1|nr:hypothetical protein EHI_192790 [Entamoeba histolytica HM-1:IMSS]EMD44611.1 HIT zinc finger protein, putative [Entamoeba histolytica KU27]EMH72772.1 HIT zinc finger, putative [Entamoeba histolytica HM-1:IMSS-B]EMS11843.1 HIT zinc finger protein [Entamoeba histolytica HM-3:IMSS]ENY65013.1 HIT zinc finger protein, putative [Entamoeba histolytica HM-1:IMSS-A]GAT98129.1 hypothetical protein CL6EHI_192790 [Entamoeba histolytica]|eukprot:XP_649198.1 hypothetical protein EHI_192790 [Entamoeba histolytica HM-1:IMSS]